MVFVKVEGCEAWIEETNRKTRYQIIRRGEYQFDWHFIRGILARANGSEETLAEAMKACERDKAARENTR